MTGSARTVAKRGLAAATAILAACSLTAADAASRYVSPNAKFTTHDHSVDGDGFHLQLQAGSDGVRMRSVVGYSERCRMTFEARRLAFAPDGTLTARGQSSDPAGSWQLSLTASDPRTLHGTFSVTTSGCSASYAVHAVAQGGGNAHGQHGHVGYPQLSKATRRQRSAARRLWRASRRAARRFPSYGAALVRGYVEYQPREPRPTIFHLKHRGFERDRHVLRPDRAEALVYWQPKSGRPALVGLMFRTDADEIPSFARPLLAWHQHLGPNGFGATAMSHVWLTKGLRSAFANCLPVPQLERDVRGFRYATPGIRPEPDSVPCAEVAAGTAPAHAH